MSRRGYFGRDEEGNGKNERPNKVIAITLSDLKHLFYCDNYWFSDSLFLDSAISFWIVSTDSFNVSSCSDVVALEAFVLSKISESILTSVRCKASCSLFRCRRFKKCK